MHGVGRSIPVKFEADVADLEAKLDELTERIRLLRRELYMPATSRGHSTAATRETR